MKCFGVFNTDRKDQRTLRLLILYSITQAIPIVGVEVGVLAGQDVELVCNVAEAADLIQIQWMRTTLKMVQKNIFTISRNMNPTPEQVDDLKDRLKFTGNVQEGIGNIVLKEANMRDTGNYSCNFIFLDGSPLRKTIQLKVQAQPKVTIAPLVGKCAAPLATCSADNAFPAAEVSWNISSLGNTVTFKTNSTENPDGTTNVTSNLMGVPSRDLYWKEVQCLIRHPTLKGEGLAINYSISSNSPPLPPRVTPLKSPSLGFKCQVDGNPEAVNYTWKRNGLPLSGNRVQADVNLLQFQEFTSDMNGQYDCEVSNMYGSATGSLHLYIYQNERHYFFFWIPFIVCVLGVCILLYRFVSRRKSTDINLRYSRGQNEETTHSEQSRQEHPRQMQEISSSKDSPEQSAHMISKERRSSREEDVSVG